MNSFSHAIDGSIYGGGGGDNTLNIEQFDYAKCVRA